MKMTDTDLQGDQKKIDDLGLAVSDRIEIKDVSLIEARVLRRDFSDNASYRVEIQRKARVLDRDSKSFRVVAELRFLAFQNHENSQTVGVEVSAVFSLRYAISDDPSLTDENFDAFAQSNGVFNAWPYFREFLQSSLVRVGLPPFTLPVLRFTNSDLLGNQQPNEPDHAAGDRQ
ncbi:MAG: hypothetical protein JNG88_03690 [Phycisphaerales bacterium]|nr:hypothetical protein [Phycisphaerales bacterium]